MQQSVVVSPSGAEIAELAASLRRDERIVVGIVGVPGAGKSTFADALRRELGRAAVTVPMDGYHLADVELDRLGLRDRKGAPETFDAYGYAALLERIRARAPHIVYAPGFERDLEQPIAGALPVGPEPDVVITEGNYLLLDAAPWRAVRSALDEVWYVHTDDAVRVPRLVDRHIRFGKPPDAAREWVQRVDEPNARLVAAGRERANRLIDITVWRHQ